MILLIKGILFHFIHYLPLALLIGLLLRTAVLTRTRLKFVFINNRSLSSKALLINYLIIEHNLDMVGLCETWLRPNVSLPLNEVSPPKYTTAHAILAMTQGGGVASIYKSIFNLTFTWDIKFNSFEALIIKPSSLTTNCLVQGTGFHLVVIYKPPGP